MNTVRKPTVGHYLASYLRGKDCLLPCGTARFTERLDSQETNFALGNVIPQWQEGHSVSLLQNEGSTRYFCAMSWKMRLKYEKTTSQIIFLLL